MLVADYLSLSNHLQMRWLITPATTATRRDNSNSIANTSLPCQYRRRQRCYFTISFLRLPQFYLTNIYCRLIHSCSFLIAGDTASKWPSAAHPSQVWIARIVFGPI